MQRYFIPSAGGFFSEDVHGARFASIGDGATPQPNPNCLIPDDAVAISDPLWSALLAATAEGMTIVMMDGTPFAQPPAEGSNHG